VVSTVQKSMTLDDLEWQKRTHREKSFYGAHQKNCVKIVSEDIMSGKMSICPSVILVTG